MPGWEGLNLGWRSSDTAAGVLTVGKEDDMARPDEIAEGIAKALTMTARPERPCHSI